MRKRSELLSIKKVGKAKGVKMRGEKDARGRPIREKGKVKAVTVKIKSRDKRGGGLG
jgi:hypothetical protein